MRKLHTLLVALAVLAVGAPQAKAGSAGSSRSPAVALKHPGSPLVQAVEGFKKLPRESQIALVKALRDFASQWEGGYGSNYAELTPAERERFEAVAQAFIALFAQDAWAEGEEKDMTCLYGGWGSVANGKCPSPARTNPLYKKLFDAAKAAGKCQDGGFLCAPALFGPDLCLTPDQQTPATIGSTYQNCKIAFDKDKRTLDQVVDHISNTPQAMDALRQMSDAMSEQCLDQDGDNFKVKDGAPGMCKAVWNRFNEIVKKQGAKYPDRDSTDDCYSALDSIKGCETPQTGKDAATRKWTEGKSAKGCGYYGRTTDGDYEGIEAYRVKGKDEAIVLSPSKNFLTGKSQNASAAAYRITGAKLTDRTKDVQGLVGTNGADLAKQTYFDTRVSYDDAYNAALNEMTLQIQERTEELRNEKDPGKAKTLKTNLAKAVHACAKVKDAGFVAARGGACALGITGDGCPRVSSGQGGGGTGTGATKGK